MRKYMYKWSAKGASLIEYGIIAGLIGVASLSAISNMGDSTEGAFNAVAAVIATPLVIPDPCGTLNIGESCTVDGTTYIGDSSSGRLYMDFTTLGYRRWKFDPNPTIPDLAGDNGYANTHALLSHGIENGYTYPIAAMCVSLGKGWFLPTYDEMMLIRGYYDSMGLNPRALGYYMASSTTSSSGTGVLVHNFDNNGSAYVNVNQSTDTLCIRTFVS